MKKKLFALMTAVCMMLTLTCTTLPVHAAAMEADQNMLLDEENATLSVPVAIFNSTGMDIYYIYISPSSSSRWGDDLLGDSVLEDGEYTSATINVDLNETSIDIKIENLWGDEYVWYDQDIGKMSAEGFGIEFLFDGEDAYVNFAEYDSDLFGYYA